MPYRRCLLVLVAGLTVSIVAFAVLMAFQAIFSALGDVAAARILFGIAIACLILLAVDVLLLVGVLGMLAVRDQNDDRRRPDQSDDGVRN